VDRGATAGRRRQKTRFCTSGAPWAPFMPAILHLVVENRCPFAQPGGSARWRRPFPSPPVTTQGHRRFVKNKRAAGRPLGPAGPAGFPPAWRGRSAGGKQRRLAGMNADRQHQGVGQASRPHVRHHVDVAVGDRIRTRPALEARSEALWRSKTRRSPPGKGIPSIPRLKPQ